MNLIDSKSFKDSFLNALNLFNNQEWYQAHDAFEEIWNTLDGDERQVIQGILQVSVSQFHLNKGNLKVKLIGRGTAWLDTGTIDSLHEASSYIRTLENRQGLKISCPEEIAWRNNWINSDQLENLAKEIKNSEYGKYLLKLLKENEIEKELS